MNLLILFLFLFSHSVFATECAPKNFITEPNSPFQKIPVYDQDGIGVCFAYAAAQMMDYYLIKNGASARNVHPIWAALAHARSVEKDTNKVLNDISLGDIYKTIQATSKENCSYNTVENSLSTMAKKANVTDAELVSFIEIYMSNYRIMYDGKKAMSLLDNTPISIEEKDILTVINETKGHTNLSSCSSNATWDQLLPELRSLSVMTTPDAISSLIMPACMTSKNSINFPKVSSVFSNADEEKILEEFSNKMDMLNAPVAITYCSKFMKLPTHDGVVSRPPGHNAPELTDDCEAHVSVVAGKKQVGNSCQLLIRNSWGSNFSNWTIGRKCLCKHKQTGVFLDDCTIADNNGQYTVEGCWIEEEQIKKNSLTMLSIE